MRKGPRNSWELFRADAKAEGTVIVLGGWCLPGGREDPAQAKWFSVTLGPEEVPWAYAKGLPYRVVAALELLATIICLMLFVKAAAAPKGAALRLVGSTDNKTNSAVISKYMTTAFPLSVILMELATLAQDLNVQLALEWRARELNIEADALTNLDFSAFKAENRLPVVFQELPWRVMPSMMDAGIALF